MTDIRDEVAAALDALALNSFVLFDGEDTDDLLRALAARGLTVVREGLVRAAIELAEATAKEHDDCSWPPCGWCRMANAVLVARQPEGPR